MSNHKYRLSQKAIEDLSNIWLYTFNKWSKEQADRHFNLIVEEINFISKNHTAGRSVEETRKNYRLTKVKSHLIFYRKTDEIIEIVRILHQRMDIRSRLK